jgi:hypothetical protein
MEYVGNSDLWLSPSAVSSVRGSSSGGSYTAADEHCRNALASLQWAMSRPTDSALAARSLSHLPLLATARLST